MKDRDKLTELLIESFKPVEAEQPEDTGAQPQDADSVDIDALEARIMARIENRLNNTTEPKQPEGQPIEGTEGTEGTTNE